MMNVRVQQKNPYLLFNFNVLLLPLDRNDPNIQSQIYKIMNYKTNNDKKAKQTLTPKEFAEFLKVSKQGSE